jgi:hypothetical protein
MAAWFDTSQAADAPISDQAHRVDLTRVLPFIALHLACVAVLWVGVSPVALAVAAALYVVRMKATRSVSTWVAHQAWATGAAWSLVRCVCVNGGRTVAFVLMSGEGSQPLPLTCRLTQHRKSKGGLPNTCTCSRTALTPSVQCSIKHDCACSKSIIIEAL